MPIKNSSSKGFSQKRLPNRDRNSFRWGAIWNRHDFSEQTIIEIRPSDNISSSDLPLVGDIYTLLDFTPEKIAILKHMGYQDAQRCLEPILQTLVGVKQQRQVENILLDSTQMLLDEESL